MTLWLKSKLTKSKPEMTKLSVQSIAQKPVFMPDKPATFEELLAIEADLKAAS